MKDIKLTQLKTEYDHHKWKISHSSDRTRTGALIMEIHFRKKGWGHDAYLRKALSHWEFGEERFYAIKQISDNEFLLATSNKYKDRLCFIYLLKIEVPGEISAFNVVSVAGAKGLGSKLSNVGFLGKDYLVINGNDTSSNLCVFSTKTHKDFVDELRRELEYLKLKNDYAYAEYTYEICALENGTPAVIVSGPYPKDDKDFNPPSWRQNHNTTVAIFDIDTRIPCSPVYNSIRDQFCDEDTIEEFAKVCGQDRHNFTREDIPESSHKRLQIDMLIHAASLNQQGRH